MIFLLNEKLFRTPESSKSQGRKSCGIHPCFLLFSVKLHHHHHHHHQHQHQQRQRQQQQQQPPPRRRRRRRQRQRQRQQRYAMKIGNISKRKVLSQTSFFRGVSWVEIHFGFLLLNLDPLHTNNANKMARKTPRKTKVTMVKESFELVKL